MKKQLLLLIALFTFGFVSAQLNQPADINICQNGPSAVSLSEQTAYILGTLPSDDYTVTYHYSQADAQAQANPLPDPFWTEISQIIFVRVTDNADQSFDILSFMITISSQPLVSNFGYDVCDSDNNNDGYANVDLGSIAEQIWTMTGSSFNELNVTFYETMADAQMAANPLSWNGYMNTTPYSQTIFVRSEYSSTGCSTVSSVNLYVNQCSNCWGSSQATVVNITQTSAMPTWIEMGSATSWNLYLVPSGAPAPTETSVGIIATSNPFVLTGLQCNTAYDFYVKSMCSGTESSAWSMPISFETMNCFGFDPVNLAECAENGQACFDLTANNQIILGNLNPVDFTITYHTSEADASNNTGVIPNAASYCIPVTMVSPMIYVRIQNNNTSDFEISSFAITAQDAIASTIQMLPAAQCDEDGNGFVIFNLVSAAVQLNTENALTFYSDSNDAMTEVNPIVNPTAYSVASPSGVTIFIREAVSGSCDIVHSLQVFATPNCNIATICAAANSLCNSLGVPFANTVNMPNAEPNNDYACLASQPNPTWFFIPVETSGAINLFITQENSSGQGIDVDYICYGPFNDPVTPCSGLLTANAVVGCSYSTAAAESVTIPGQAGKYYLMMVTNFSNEPGFVTISQTNANQPSSGQISCNGLSLIAYLDSNGDGDMDAGESNFPLGQFNYERNNDGNVHNITAPSGVYNIYDTNASNSYDFGYTIDPAYAANYSLVTPSYSDIDIIAGGGMQEYYFPIVATQAYADLAVSVLPIQAPRPGFSYDNLVTYTNLGNETVASGTVTFTKDALVSIIANSQSGTVSNATGFTYTFTNLLPFETREMTVTMQVPNVPTVQLGNLLTNTATIAPLAGDIAPENNTSTSSQVIIGSYDPNDKMESRGRQILFSDFTNDDYLYYTVRFENTGTASAINVRISDVLDNGLDETTVRMVDASHNYILDRVDNILTWRFDNIQLPTTLSAPQEGKGFVHFKVKPRPGFAVGDIIQNTASIFFDFNPPIVTNTFETEFVEFLGTDSFTGSGFSMYPNPAGDHVMVSLNGQGTISTITVYDLLGKTVLIKTGSATTESVDISQVSSGVYLLEMITGNNAREIKKLVIK
jgi:uncharacterized repeat protein (TIGR01451 family)